MGTSIHLLWSTYFENLFNPFSFQTGHGVETIQMEFVEDSLTKKSKWYTTDYHWISLSTFGPFNDISVGLSGTLSGNLKYHSIPRNGLENPKYHSKTIRYNSNTLAIISLMIIQVLCNGILNGIWMVFL